MVVDYEFLVEDFEKELDDIKLIDLYDKFEEKEIRELKYKD